MFPLANSLNPLGSVVAAAAGGSPTYTEAITAFGASSPRNNFSDFVGFKFTMNANKAMHSIGRIKLTGNSATRLVMLFSANSIPLASALIDLSTGTVGAMVYSDLIADVPLASGSAYYLMSREINGGDTWYDEATATPTADLTVNLSCANTTGGGETFLPRNDFTGTLGYKFTASINTTVTKLGRLKLSPADSASHTVTLYDSGGSSLGSVTINNSGQPTGLLYSSLGSPISITSGSTYYIESAETNGGDLWFGSTAGVLTSDFTLLNASFNQTAGTAGHMYVPVDFIYGSNQSALSSMYPIFEVDAGKAFVYPNFKYS